MRVEHSVKPWQRLLLCVDFYLALAWMGYMIWLCYGWTQLRFTQDAEAAFGFSNQYFGYWWMLMMVNHLLSLIAAYPDPENACVKQPERVERAAWFWVLSILGNIAAITLAAAGGLNILWAMACFIPGTIYNLMFVEINAVKQPWRLRDAVPRAKVSI